MNRLLLVVTVGTTWALLLATGFLIVGDYKLVVRLREHHQQVWGRLGSPSPWFYRLEDLTSVYRFLVAREYVTLGDPELSALANRIRILTYTVYALTAATVVLMALTRFNM
ncbi:MAG: hypothetical protein ACJ79I_06130 [Gemmatimonadaceae bacterium]